MIAFAGFAGFGTEPVVIDGVKYPPGTVFDEEGYPMSWSYEYECWMHHVLWDQGTGTPIYSLQPIQWELVKLTPLLRPHGEAGPTRIGFGGAAGGTKSHTARAVAAMIAQLWPGSNTIIFRETEDAVKENHVDRFELEVPPELYEINRADLVVKWNNGSRTRFGFLGHDKHLKKYQGQEYDCMIFEEGTHFLWKWVSWLMGNRLRSSTAGTTPFVLIPTNPGNVGHFWFKRLFVDRNYHSDNDERAEDHVFLQARLDDNYVLRKRDPAYIRKLNTLTEPHRSWLRDGDFHAGAGTGLPQLSRSKHIVPFFVPPAHWPMFGGFDWGFDHPFSFGIYAVNEDNRVFKVDTITGRWLQPLEICDRIIEVMKMRGLNHERLMYVAAGHDAWADHKARGENLPTIAERMIARGIPLIKANISRVAGLNNLREFLAWEKRGPNGEDDDPGLVFMKTPGNLLTFSCLEERVPDPLNIEDVLKTDADAFGQGGDDYYDETRYALASRPPRAASLIKQQYVRAFSKAALVHEMEQGRKVKDRSPIAAGTTLLHPEFGDIG